MPNPDVQEIVNQKGTHVLADSQNMVQGTCEETVLFPKYTDPYPVYLNMPVWRQLWQYACDNKDREIGGVLLGNLLKDQDSSALDIQAYLPGRYMEETLARLTFTHRTWNDINQRHIREHIDKRVIGWFHTHPGHGIFLSKHDLYIHQNYFKNTEQIAVVFDPVHNSAGFFQCQGNRVRQLREIHIYTLAGYAFDQNTRDFINTVSEHSQPECQPSLSLPIEIDIQNGPSREARHQGLAFLLQLMDIQKQDQTASDEDLQTTSLMVDAGSTLEQESDAKQDKSGQSPTLDNESINESDGIPDLSLQQSELTSPDIEAIRVPEAPSEEFKSTLLVSSLVEADIMPDRHLNRQSNQAARISPIGEERFSVVMKKLIPIKDQVARDLRRAEREILSPPDNPRYVKPIQTYIANSSGILPSQSTAGDENTSKEPVENHSAADIW